MRILNRRSRTELRLALGPEMVLMATIITSPVLAPNQLFKCAAAPIDVAFELAPKSAIGRRSRHVPTYVTLAATRVGARTWAHKSAENERDAHKAWLAGSVNHYLASPACPSLSEARAGRGGRQGGRRRSAHKVSPSPASPPGGAHGVRP